MKKYKYFIMSTNDPSNYSLNPSSIESDEEDITKIPLPKSVSFVYKFAQDEYDIREGGVFYMGVPATIKDVKKELAYLRKKSDSSIYKKYINHLDSLVSTYDKNFCLVYKTHSGVYGLGTKGIGIIVSPTLFAENDSKPEEDHYSQFDDKSYIDLEWLTSKKNTTCGVFLII